MVSKNARFTIGLEFWTAFLSLGGVFNFQGERIHSEMHPLPEHVQAQEVTDLIVTEIERVLLDLHIEKERVIGGWE